jgi:hypothetical protein
LFPIASLANMIIVRHSVNLDISRITIIYSSPAQALFPSSKHG